MTFRPRLAGCCLVIISASACLRVVEMFGPGAPGEGGVCEVAADCRVGKCLMGVCTTQDWVGLGGAELVAWPQTADIGSHVAGGVSQTASVSAAPDMAAGPGGVLAVTWQELVDTVNYEICVRYFDGSQWRSLASSASGGGISNNAGDSRDPAVAIDSNGWPVVAWAQTTGTDDEIYVARYDGSAWVGMTGSNTGGGISNNSGDSQFPRLALDAQGTVFVSWQDDSSGNSEIYVAQYAAGAWGAVGVGSRSGGGISNTPRDSKYPSLVIGGDDNPIVAWQDQELDAFDAIFVARFDGASWVDMGAGSRVGTGISDRSFRPSLVVDSSGQVTAAWEVNPGYTIESASYNSLTDAWLALPSLDANNDVASNARLFVDQSDTVFVTWEQQDIWLARLDGGVWSLVEPLAGDLQAPAGVTLGGSTPVVARSVGNNTANSEILVSAYLDGAWGGVGDHLENLGGLLQATEVISPSLGGTDERPAVVWEQRLTPPGSGTVYLVQSAEYAGGQWQIAAPAIPGRAPSVTSGGSSAAVAWQSGGICTGAPATAGWQPVGANVDTNGCLGFATTSAVKPSMVVSGSDTLLLWQEPSPLSVLRVGRLAGSTWSQLGADLGSTWPLSRLAVGTAGTPYVADTQGGNVRVWQYDGQNWAPVPNYPSVSGVFYAFTLGCLGDLPVVAWSEYPEGTRQGVIYAALFDGVAWQPLGPAGTAALDIRQGSGYITDLVMVQDREGLPVMAWSDPGTGNNEIYIARYDGTAWVPLTEGSTTGGGISRSGGDSRTPSVAVYDGAICVAWSEASWNNSTVVVRCAAAP